MKTGDYITTLFGRTVLDVSQHASPQTQSQSVCYYFALGRYLHPKTSSTLYDFGYGLSYTNFSLQCHLLPSAQPLQDRQSSATTGAPEPWSAPAVVVSPVAHHLRSRVDAAAWFNVSCTVRNIGNRAGDEVVIVYHSPSAAVRVAANHVLPQRRLIAFTRVTHMMPSPLCLCMVCTASLQSRKNHRQSCIVV